MNTATVRIPRQLMIWLAAGILFSALPHTIRISSWISIMHIMLVFARMLLCIYFPLFHLQKTFMARLPVLLVAGLSLIGVYWSYGTVMGRDPGIALLTVLAALKLFECDNERDFYIICYLGYFSVITNFFYSQTIPIAIYMCFIVILMTAILISFNDKQQSMNIFDRFRLSAALLLQAFPIMLIVFLFFPRINGPIWGLPKDAHTGVTGIDDEMSIGSISKLTQSDAVAFRVKFKERIPDPAILYWRGPVLWHTDGRKWTTGRIARDEAPAIDYRRGEIVYEVTMEATNRHWLFAIEMPARLPDESYLTADYQLKSHTPVHRQKQYTISSYTDFKNNTLRKSDLQRALALPSGKHRRTVSLADSWLAPGQTPEHIIRKALDYFRDNNFSYTLEPALLTGDPVDEFLFEKKQGFCEHYAASFTLLMRAAGIPARIVTGYQGGEINPLGGYLIVRQYHAHAWSEVWLDGQGWVRVDPTSAVSPDRISYGVESAMLESIIGIPLGLENSILAATIRQKLRNSWDAINYRWTQWILGYGPERQKAFFARLGFEKFGWKTLAIGMIATVSLALLVCALWIFNTRPKQADPAQKLYLQFCRKLEKTGIRKKSSESPNVFARRASKARRKLRSDIFAVTGIYMDIRYGSQVHKLHQLKTRVSDFAARG